MQFTLSLLMLLQIWDLINLGLYQAACSQLSSHLLYRYDRVRRTLTVEGQDIRLKVKRLYDYFTNASLHISCF